MLTIKKLKKKDVNIFIFFFYVHVSVLTSRKYMCACLVPIQARKGH